MQALTRFVLRHKLLVTFFWLASSRLAAHDLSGTTHRMTNNFAMPGQAFRVDNQIPRIRQRRLADAVRRGADRAGRAAHRHVRRSRPRRPRSLRCAAAPNAGASGSPTTPPRRNRAFITRNGRTTFALVYTAAVNGFGGPSLGPAMQRTPRCRRPGRMARRAHRRAAAVGGCAASEGHRPDGRGHDRCARRAGDPRLRVRQLPRVPPAGDRRRVRTRHVPAGGRPDRDHQHQPDRGVPDRADRAGRGDRLLPARGKPVARRARRRPTTRTAVLPRRWITPAGPWCSPD